MIVGDLLSAWMGVWGINQIVSFNCQTLTAFMLSLTCLLNKRIKILMKLSSCSCLSISVNFGLSKKHSKVIVSPLPAGNMHLVLENSSSTLLEYSRISYLIQAYFWDFLEIACWYWPDLAIMQANKLGLGRMNFRQECG